VGWQAAAAAYLVAPVVTAAVVAERVALEETAGAGTMAALAARGARGAAEVEMAAAVGLGAGRVAPGAKVEVQEGRAVMAALVVTADPAATVEDMDGMRTGDDGFHLLGCDRSSLRQPNFRSLRDLLGSVHDSGLCLS
jgi:hypothetical protein